MFTGIPLFSHLHPLQFADVSPIAYKVLHGARRKAFLLLGQVQPQPVRLHLPRSQNDDIGSGRGARIAVHPRGQGEVIRNDW